MHILIIGCGYVGERYAKQALARGWRVSALTRRSEQITEWQTQGITGIQGDVLHRESLQALPTADLCVYAVGFDRTATQDKREVYVTGLRHVLTEITDRIPRMIYISSTSVYGENNGEWVDEETICQPGNESGEICLEAEQVVQEFAVRNPQLFQASILRLSGIYGPGRLIGRREQLAQELPIAGNPESWLNLIHIDDILQALFLLAVTPHPEPLYLLSDEQPNRRIEFYSALARHLGTPAPIMPEDPTDQLGKRCDSSQIRNVLGLQLLRPTIVEGIPASLTGV